MKLHSPKLLLLANLFFGSMLVAQLDSTAVANLSKLSPEQKKQLAQKYGIGSKVLSQTSPTSNLPNRDLKLVIPNAESFDDRSDFLGDLDQMEKIISSDVIRLESLINAENSSRDNELLEAFEESKALLRKIKQLQRREIEKRAEEFGKSETDAIKPFGYDLFASDPTTFAPGNEVPIPFDYRIGPGDLIEIQLFGQRNDSFSISISREGMLRFPGIGPINAFEKGTKFIDLKNHLKEKIHENLGDGVQSSITLGGFRSIRVFLLGEVRKQGAYTVSALSTTVNALLSCGGIKETGSLRNIQLKRAGKTIATLDLYDLLLAGNTSLDQPLQPGDVIFVPIVARQVSVSGAVKRPAKYEIGTGETLSKVIELAGGTSDRSALDLIRLERLDSEFHTIVKNLNFYKDKDFEIFSGDSISIGYAGSKIKNVVSIVGAVENVGDYEWKEGLQLGDLITDSNDFLPNVDLDYGIIRRRDKKGIYSCHSFRPHEVINKDGKPIDLQSQDLIYFLSRDHKSRRAMLSGLISDLRRQTISGEFAKIVKIAGAIHFPGEYPLSESMNLNDLFYAGGGTKDSAYMLDAEITRIFIDSNQHAAVKHIRLDQSTISDSELSNSFKLEPYDILSIKPIPLWREDESIKLVGEFKFPGVYSIKAGERLIDVINRAGGLTDRAFAKGAIFSRENLRAKEDEQKERLIAQLESDLANATLSAKDTKGAAQTSAAAQAMLTRLQNSKSQGRLVINLEEMLYDSKNSSILVKSGDILTIPQVPYAVSVTGEVHFPTSHMYEKSLGLKDYLKRSGGFTQNADKDQTFVVKSNGAVIANSGNAWFGGGDRNRVEVGDVIVVPIDIKQSKILENLANGTQVIYQLAVAAAAVNSF